jgi:cytochrome c peroxidase
MIRAGWKSTILLAMLIAAAWSAFSPHKNSAFAAPGDNPPDQRNGQRNGGGGGGSGHARRIDNQQIEVLGKAIFFDKNISNPTGMSCASCHAPETGFTYPNSYTNKTYGTVPGAIQNRFGNRKPMTISYSWFVPDGPAFFRRRQQNWEGGFFYDGRASSLQDQASQPMVNPNEMDNLDHGLGSPDMVVKKVLAGTYTDLIRQAYGTDALTKSPSDIFNMMREAITAYEQSRDVSPFSSKYDAYVQGDAQLTESEMNGLRLFTGSVTGRPGGAANTKSAECITCHTIADSSDGRRDFFTNWTYANIGVPKNPHNPFYKQTNSKIDPQGYNSAGDKYVDLGLGNVLYPKQNLPSGNIGPGSDGRGDFLQANGTFRVASLRNVDKRPSPDFVKCYMHNGVFKSLKEVVHFYNTRNLTKRGEVIDLVSANPYANLKSKPLWPLPEYPSPTTLQNASGHPSTPTARVGNLGLTDQEENDIVAFLGTLSDGYFTPQRRRPPPPN